MLYHTSQQCAEPAHATGPTSQAQRLPTRRQGIWRQNSPRLADTLGMRPTALLTTAAGSLATVCCLVLFSFLSNLASASEAVVLAIMRGDLHTLLIHDEVWRSGLANLTLASTAHYVVQPLAALWLLLLIGGGAWLLRRRVRAIPLGVVTLLVGVASYGLALLYLMIAQPAPSEVGPVVAWALGSVLYAGLIATCCGLAGNFGSKRAHPSAAAATSH